MNNHIEIALLMSAMAGLSTTIGSLFGISIKKPSDRLMSFVLGFSAGVMIMVSFVELLANSIESIGFLSANIGFLVGMGVMFLIDYFIPHEYIGQKDCFPMKQSDKLLRAGLLIALGIGIHNFPEGIVTFVSTLKDVKLGGMIAVAIALHNIPEGLAVAIPVYAATCNRRKAFLWSFFPGLAEPLGALMACFILAPILNATVLGWTLGIVAGIMIFISLDELIPLSKSFGEEHLPILGIIIGMMFIIFSSFILKV
ncbi:MAG: zinc transporter ZupT [bacterium]